MKFNKVTRSYALNPRFKRYFPDLCRQVHFGTLSYADGLQGIGEYAYLNSVHGQKGQALIDLLEEPGLIERLKELDKMEDEDTLAHFFSTIPYPASYLLSMSHFHRHCLKNGVQESRDIFLQALIVEDDKDACQKQSLKRAEEGFETLKIKMNGFLPIEQNIRKIGLLLEHLPKTIRLRLDGNQSFSQRDARSLIDSIDMARIDYFEEPTNNVAKWSSTITKKIAADESYFSSSLAFLKEALVTHLIVRPSSFHDLYSLKKLIMTAKEMGFRVVFSHAYETAFTRDVLALYIAKLGLFELTHGLYEWDFFKDTACISYPFRLSPKDCLKRIFSYAF